MGKLRSVSKVVRVDFARAHPPCSSGIFVGIGGRRRNVSFIDPTAAASGAHAGLERLPSSRARRLTSTAWNYRLGFVIDLLATPSLVAVGYIVFQGPRVAALGLLAVGALACTLLEYAFHRWLCHGRTGIAARVHARHHARADDPVAFPAFLPVVICATFGLPAVPILGVGAAALFVAGMECGFLYYETLHHFVHRTPSALPRFARRLAARHSTHHAHPRCNFGTTTAIWDRAFGTERTLRPRRAAASCAPGCRTAHPLEVADDDRRRVDATSVREETHARPC